MSTKSHDVKLDAARRLQRGERPSDVARACKVSTSTLARWRKSRPHLFEVHEPGSVEHRRAVLLEALETGNLSERLRAVELLERLGQSDGRAPGATTIYVAALDHCPHCGAKLEPVTEEPEEEPDSS